eukprot:1140740-Pelagomonas_calceolata.AAC.2
MLDGHGQRDDLWCAQTHVLEHKGSHQQLSSSSHCTKSCASLVRVRGRGSALARPIGLASSDACLTGAPSYLSSPSPFPSRSISMSSFKNGDARLRMSAWAGSARVCCVPRTPEPVPPLHTSSTV